MLLFGQQGCSGALVLALRAASYEVATASGGAKSSRNALQHATPCTNSRREVIQIANATLGIIA